MNRKRIFSVTLALTLLLLSSSYISLGSAANSSKQFTSEKEIPCSVNLNLKPALGQLGFTDDNSSLAPRLLINSLLKIPTTLIPNSDETYNATLYLNSTQLSAIKESSIYQNGNTNTSYIKAKNTTPTSSPIKTFLPTLNNTLIPQNSTSFQSENLKISSPETSVGSSGLKACLIVAIWNYPNPNYLPEAQDEYNDVNNNLWGYDTVVRLLNNDATYANIVQNLQDLCSSYSIVDVYFIGHGSDIFGSHYFCSWDTIDFLGGCGYYWNGIYDVDLISYNNCGSGDLSNLRMCVASFCTGWCLEDGFMNTNQNFAHNRVFMGPQGLLLVSTYTPDGTGNMFDETWTVDWCQQSLSSSDAFADAYTAAEPTVPSGCTNFAYAESNGPVYYDFYVTQANAWGCLSGSGNAWAGNNLVGQNDDNYAHIYGGNYGDAGYVRATMNVESSGEIVVYGYGVDGYYSSDLYCYVSNDGSNWYAAPNNPVQVNYWDGMHYIDFGASPITYRYIAFAGYDDNGYSVNVMLDAVHGFN
jgi:hypothetical protein